MSHSVTSKQEQILQNINEKFHAIGQDPLVHLEGLQYAKPITYWDYVEVDTLLNLQKQRTTLPDELVFIMYHQVTELLFKMILSEIRQIANHPALGATFFIERLGRINRYFQVLESSFAIMKDGMEVAQYLQFRTTLTPASGFQSAQYRMIEICSTDLDHLIDHRFRGKITSDAAIEQKLDHLYWQAAGKNFETSEKSATLRLFEEKYLASFVALASDYRQKNLWQKYLTLPAADRQNEALISALRDLDYMINVQWVMAHYRTAEKYLESNGEVKAATGGSPWKKYMHPRYQRRIFFPDLWSEAEKERWGEEETV